MRRRCVRVDRRFVVREENPRKRPVVFVELIAGKTAGAVVILIDDDETPDRNGGRQVDVALVTVRIAGRLLTEPHIPGGAVVEINVLCPTLGRVAGERQGLSI